MEQQGSKSMAVQPKSFGDIWTSMEQQGSKSIDDACFYRRNIWTSMKQQGSKRVQTIWQKEKSYCMGGVRTIYVE